jgi:hypothetical protein
MNRALRRCSVGCAVALALSLAAAPAAAQPFGAWLTSNPGHPTTHGYARIPHRAALNPTAAFTLELWYQEGSLGPGETCRSLVGKNFQQTWWVGVCTIAGQRTVRSYLKGGLASQRNGGIIPLGQWTHIAVVFDGSTRKHYINGEQVLSVAETGPLPTNTAEVRIFSDVAWEFSPPGSINEVRLWNTARSQAQLRANLNQAIAAQPGLVALWRTGGTDVVGPNDGALVGDGVGILTFPVAGGCGSTTPTSLCLRDRFRVTSKFRIGPPGTVEGTSQTIDCPNPESGLFRFQGANNWEVMVKVLDGCELSDTFWVFTAATTNLFYRLEVFDTHGAQKIYFNYPGPPAPAVTDTGAFATCP